MAPLLLKPVCNETKIYKGGVMPDQNINPAEQEKKVQPEIPKNSPKENKKEESPSPDKKQESREGYPNQIYEETLPPETRLN